MKNPNIGGSGGGRVGGEFYHFFKSVKTWFLDSLRSAVKMKIIARSSYHLVKKVMCS